MNPSTSIWFTPHKTATWARDNHPLYGVVVLLVLHVVVTLVSFTIESPETSTPEPAPGGRQKFGLYLDVWVLPVVFLFVLYWIANRLDGKASLTNVLWVMAWSQLPVILLTLISMLMELTGLRIHEPLFANKLITENGQIFFDPPTPQPNMHGMIFFAISTVLLLWSFQILISGVAAVSGVAVKRALWFLTLALIALILIRLPFTIFLADRDLLDILGLKGVIES